MACRLKFIGIIFPLLRLLFQLIYLLLTKEVCTTRCRLSFFQPEFMASGQSIKAINLGRETRSHKLQYGLINKSSDLLIYPQVQTERKDFNSKKLLN